LPVVESPYNSFATPPLFLFYLTPVTTDNSIADTLSLSAGTDYHDIVKTGNLVGLVRPDKQTFLIKKDATTTTVD